VEVDAVAAKVNDADAERRTGRTKPRWTSTRDSWPAEEAVLAAEAAECKSTKKTNSIRAELTTSFRRYYGANETLAI
jgi:hypothetical protein